MEKQNLSEPVDFETCLRWRRLVGKGISAQQKARYVKPNNMGLESYLLRVNLKTSLSEKDLISLFEHIGLVYLSENSLPYISIGYKDHYFELRTPKGLTEIHALLGPEDTKVDEFSLRFSVLSPRYVIDQTFELLRRLNAVVPIEIFDTEIRNHIFRQLRQEGKVDRNFGGLNQKNDEAINRLCMISPDCEDFKRNEFAIAKRQIVLNNEHGEVVEGGSATFDVIEKKGLFERFIGWIKKEL